MNELILDGIVDSVIKELTKTSQNLKTTDSDNDGASDEVEKQAKTNPEDPKDVPDVYDPTDQERKDLVDAYDQFKEKFYQVRKMAQQGNLIRILIAQLQKIQDSQKDDVENSYEKVEDDETKTADTSDTSPSGRLAKKDQLAKKAQEPMLAKEQEEKKVARKQLQNIKTDVRSFYQEILATKKLLKKAGKIASAGKLEFSLVKEKFIEQMKKIQDDVGEIYNDLILISPAKEIKEQDENPRLAASKKITAVYNEISKMLGPIIDVIKSEQPVPEFRMIPVIDSSLEKLNKIVDFFPSVKAFSGQKGTFEDLENSYSEMIRDMSYLNDNFQNLIKDENMSSVTIRNLYIGLKKFSKEIEEKFGVSSKIKDKESPLDPDAKAIEPSDQEADLQQDKPDEEKEKTEKVLAEPENVSEHFKENIMSYRAFKQIFTNPNINEEHYNSIMLLYALEKYKDPALQEKEGFDTKAVPTLVRQGEIFLGFDKEKLQDDLMTIKSLNKNHIKNLLQFFSPKNTKTEKRRDFDNIVRTQMRKNPFSISLKPDIMIQRNNLFYAKELKDDERSKNLAQRTAKARGKKRTSGKYDFGKLPATDYPGLPYRENKEQKISKSLKPLIEKILREQ